MMTGLLRTILLASGLILADQVWGQDREIRGEGRVSYVTPQNVYTKFSSTESIATGDTLFRKDGLRWIPALVVRQRSSISCVCDALPGPALRKDDAVFALSTTEPVRVEPSPSEPANVESLPPPSLPPPADPLVSGDDLTEDGLTETASFKEKISGRISAASYTTAGEHAPQHRFRYSLAFRGDHLHGSRWSAESFITFRHNAGEWETVKENPFDALKIFNMAVRYEPTTRTRLTLGRKINPRISSMGAIDGLQAEHQFGSVQVGLMAGTRPDYQDYGFNPDLLQAGAYVGWGSSRDGLSHQTTLALVEQQNHGQTDRRFIYIQHNQNLVRNLNVFTSMEVDLYQKVNGDIGTQPRLTNLFATLRYRFSRNFSASVAYDNRRNVIFFESFKGYLDQLIDQETRQGLRATINGRVFRRLTYGLNASWRFQASGDNPSQNLNGYLTWMRLPGIGGNLSASYNQLETGYLSARYYGARWTRDYAKGRIGSDIYYRWVDTDRPTAETIAHQDIVGLSLSFRATRKLGVYLYGERTFDDRYQPVNRINLKVIRRW